MGRHESQIDAEAARQSTRDGYKGPSIEQGAENALSLTITQPIEGIVVPATQHRYS